jgi:redox-sensitive bicupin YhaK (pirin superfamily)
MRFRTVTLNSPSISGTGLPRNARSISSLAQSLDLCAGIHFPKHDFHLGVLAGKLPQGRRENARQHGSDVTDSQFDRRLLAKQSHVPDRFVAPAQQVARMRQEVFARRGQAQSTFLAKKKFHSKLCFQIPYLAAHGRLRNAQTGGGAADIQLFCRRHEVAQMPEFHAYAGITKRHGGPKNKALGRPAFSREAYRMKTTTLIERETTAPLIVKRSAEARGTTNFGWLHSRHTFSFGNYFDPDHMGFRSLRVINDDVVEPGAGFGEHPHRDAEIFSYVIEGELEHKDSMGNGRIIKAGDLQYISAGSGVLHSEFNPSPKNSVHFLQIWLMPRTGGGEPRYAEKALGKGIPSNALTLLFAGEPREGAVGIRADADIYFGKLDAGGRLTHRSTPARGQWLHVIEGDISALGERLERGDGAAIENAEALEIQSGTGAQFLLFDLK